MVFTRSKRKRLERMGACRVMLPMLTPRAIRAATRPIVQRNAAVDDVQRNAAVDDVQRNAAVDDVQRNAAVDDVEVEFIAHEEPIPQPIAQPTHEDFLLEMLQKSRNLKHRAIVPRPEPSHVTLPQFQLKDVGDRVLPPEPVTEPTLFEKVMTELLQKLKK